ncbi:MAG TPA: hypothetical protein VGT41_04635 [Candidatus Babeliales bacterium]|nr:hypothetical protein [Candidatus Babeliales bacterium]
MKSIIEEASSVAKAIEKGWEQAGKPQEFSVRVFQESEKNFIGMTKTPAKIAILFDYATPAVGEKQEKKQTKYKSAPVQQKHISPTEKPTHTPAPAQQKQHVKPVRVAAEQQQANTQERVEKKNEPFWTDAMTAEITSWMNGALQLLGKPNSGFTFDVKRYYLKISFNTPLFADKEKERTVFRSFAHVLMQVLRNKFKKNFRGFKIILLSE